MAGRTAGKATKAKINDCNERKHQGNKTRANCARLSREEAPTRTWRSRAESNQMTATRARSRSVNIECKPVMTTLELKSVMVTTLILRYQHQHPMQTQTQTPYDTIGDEQCNGDHIAFATDTIGQEDEDEHSEIENTDNDAEAADDIDDEEPTSPNEILYEPTSPTRIYMNKPRQLVYSILLLGANSAMQQTKPVSLQNKPLAKNSMMPIAKRTSPFIQRNFHQKSLHNQQHHQLQPLHLNQKSLQQKNLHKQQHHQMPPPAPQADGPPTEEPPTATPAPQPEEPPTEEPPQATNCNPCSTSK